MAASQDLDAATIGLGNLSRLETGSFATFSPDGQHILLTKPGRGAPGDVKPKVPSLVLVDRATKRGTVLLSAAYNGAWSPDGTKVAYCRPPTSALALASGSEDLLSIYDLKSRKQFELVKVSACHLAIIAWARDGKKLFYDLPDLSATVNARLVDLDTLRAEDGSRYWCQTVRDARGYLGNRCDKDAWMKENLSIVTYPRAYFYVERRESVGLWVANWDDSFVRMLIPGFWERVWLAPDLSALVFENRNEVYVADITLVKDPPKRTFDTGIRINSLVLGQPQPLGVFAFYSRKEVEDYLANGTITAKVFDAKVNPLNGKVIGPGSTLKAVVRVLAIDESHATVQVIREISPVQPGDVVTNIRGDHRHEGRGTKQVPVVWAKIGSPR
jgi:hypothetical protein